MNKTGILIIEDDKAIKNLIATTPEIHNHHYMQADEGEQGILSAASWWPDTTLLDLRLPGVGGVDIIKKIRSWSKIPVIVISAKSEDDDKIAALDAGVDGYLAKPSSVNELLARLHATQRRLSYMQSLREDQSSTFVNGDPIVDYAAGYATLDGEELHPTLYEYKSLCLLAHNVGRILTHSYIVREVWGAAWKGDVASLRVSTVSPRRKIERTPSQSQYIQTCVGVEYRTLRQ